MTTTLAAGAFVVEREIRIDAPREDVFPFVATREGMRRWFRPTALEPRIGGRIAFGFPFDDGDMVTQGEFTAYDPPARVAFTWTWKNGTTTARTEVTIDLVAEGNVTLLKLTHTGFVDEESAQNHREGWEYWLQRLNIAAAGGDPGPDKFVPAAQRQAAIRALVHEEIALRNHAERVAEMRRELPMPAPLDGDYTLTALDGSTVRFSSLFGAQDDLIVYHLMFHPDDDAACPACSMWVDGFNAIARHVRERAAFVVIAKAPVEKLKAWAARRGWKDIAVYSSYGTTFNTDVHAEDEDGDQVPSASVFHRSADGVHHFYQKSAHLDEDTNRGIDLLSPVWNLLDLTPAGRGDWSPSNDLATARN
jgi:predicted dithiol-disulfide oxidoreductase (DUF899 family)/uncharacterized protein YndB with AHSA1/START domain